MLKSQLRHVVNAFSNYSLQKQSAEGLFSFQFEKFSKILSNEHWERLRKMSGIEVSNLGLYLGFSFWEREQAHSLVGAWVKSHSSFQDSGVPQEFLPTHVVNRLLLCGGNYSKICSVPEGFLKPLLNYKSLSVYYKYTGLQVSFCVLGRDIKRYKWLFKRRQ